MDDTRRAGDPSPPPEPPDGAAPYTDFSNSSLSRAQARDLLDRAAELMAGGDYEDAAGHYRRLVDFEEPGVRAAALLGLGEALYRLDHDDAAIATWESVLELPETPSAYQAWRNVAAARVRSGDLKGAIAAYREADRRAPAQDKPEIANRLGWLAKETGNTGASRRYFARGRQAGPAFPLTWLIIGLTVVVSFMGFSAEGGSIIETLDLNKMAVAHGDYYRLWSVTLVHADLLHLAFNMYALYLVGPIVEQLYGSWLFAIFYLLCAAAGSIGSYVFGPGNEAVGASGAIFGLFGIVLAASRTHQPVLDRRGRSLVSQIGMLIAINLAFGFLVPNIDNAAHIGGLAAGVWLGFLIAPGRVTTLRSMWQRPPGDPDAGAAGLLPAIGVAALVVVLAVGVVFGTAKRNDRTQSERPPVIAAAAMAILPVDAELGRPQADASAATRAGVLTAGSRSRLRQGRR
jgi:membrane associated rhomboid family serine protease